MTDKNSAIIEYLLTCEYIQNNSIYFNFINAKNDAKQVLADSNDRILDRRYIDGSVLKQYQCTLVDFKTLSTSPVPRALGYTDENVADIHVVQNILDWIEAQNDARNFPDFGTTCIVESIRTTANNPNLDGIDASITPALAKYSITIQVEYLDTSKVIWNKT